MELCLLVRSISFRCYLHYICELQKKSESSFLHCGGLLFFAFDWIVNTTVKTHVFLTYCLSAEIVSDGYRKVSEISGAISI